MISYTNPILPGTNPDPSVCRGADAFYLVTSSFAYFPGLPVYRSTDLFTWELVAHALTRSSQLDFAAFDGGNEIFAPTIRCHGGRYYIVTTDVGGRGNFLITADDPLGPWSEPLFIDRGLFDPSLLFEEDTVYYTRRGPRGIDQAEIDVASGRLTSEPREIARGFCSKDAEGPHLYRIGEWYYLLIAEGGSRYGHMATIARSSSPWGPFEGSPYNPILTQRHVTFSPIRDTGHAELIRDDAGAWWLFCLGTRNFGYGSFAPLGRETFLAPIAWTADGWPVINDRPAAGGSAEGAAPWHPIAGDILDRALDPHDGRRIYPVFPWPPTTGAETQAPGGFPLDRLRILPWPADDDRSAWYRYKRSDRDFFALVPEPAAESPTSRSVLEIHPTDPGGTGMLLRKQCALFCTLFLDLPGPPVASAGGAGTGAGAGAGEAGLILFLNERHQVRLALRPPSAGGGVEAVLHRRIGSVADTLATPLPAAATYRLAVVAEDRIYRFYAAPSPRGAGRSETSVGASARAEADSPGVRRDAPPLPSNAVEIGSIESRYLSPELAETWTGVAWGPYSVGTARRFIRAGEYIDPREARWWRITGDIPGHVQ